MVASRNIYKTLGETGLKHQGGVVFEEFNIELRGKQGREAMQRMADSDPVIAGVLFAIDMLIRQVEWTVQPFDESPEAEEHAQFIQECIDDMSLSWEDTVSEVLSMLVHGFSYFEILYKQRVGPEQTKAIRRSRFTDGRIGWRKFSVRSQESVYRWEFDEEGGIAGIWQLGATQWEPVFIPIEKSLLFRTTVQKSNPEGVSVLRSAYSSYYYQSNIQRIEAIGIERDIAGLPKMEVPADWMSESAEKWQKDIIHECMELVTSIRRDEQEGVLIPQHYDQNNNKMFDLSLLSTGGSRQIDLDKVIGRYDQRKAMALLADFILLGHENVGSMALSETKVGLFMTALKAWLDSISGVVNTHAIPRLMRLNGLPGEAAPWLAASDIQEIDINEVVEAITNLARVGMVNPTDELERFLLEKMGAPYTAPDDELIPEQARSREKTKDDDPVEDADSEGDEKSRDPQDDN